VGLVVLPVVVLVGKVAVRGVPGQARGDVVVAFRVLGRQAGVRLHHVHPQGGEQVDLLLAGGVAHHRLHPVALLDGSEGEAHGGVAGGVLQDQVPGLDPPVRFGALDQVLGDAVLAAAHGIEVLQLGEHLEGQPGGDPVEADHGRVPDDLQDAVVAALVMHVGALVARSRR
jgi:hypothetical protein